MYKKNKLLKKTKVENDLTQKRSCLIQNGS